MTWRDQIWERDYYAACQELGVDLRREKLLFTARELRARLVPSAVGALHVSVIGTGPISFVDNVPYGGEPNITPNWFDWEECHKEGER